MTPFAPEDIKLRVRAYHRFDKWRQLEHAGRVCVADVGEDKRGVYYVILVYDEELAGQLREKMVSKGNGQ